MRREIVAGVLLALALFATRMEHFGTPVSLPDASLAVFFFAGLWLAHRSAFLLLLGVAVATDYYAFARSGVSGCHNRSTVTRSPSVMSSSTLVCVSTSTLCSFAAFA